MVRIEVQNLATCPTPIFAKSQLSRNQEKTRSWDAGWGRGKRRQKETEDASLVISLESNATGSSHAAKVLGVATRGEETPIADGTAMPTEGNP